MSEHMIFIWASFLVAAIVIIVVVVAVVCLTLSLPMSPIGDLDTHYLEGMQHNTKFSILEIQNGYMWNC